MPVAQAVAEFQSLLAGLAGELQTKIDRFVPTVVRLGRRELLAFITDAFPELVTPFLVASGDLTATWYEDQLPGSDFRAVPADLAPVNQLAILGRWSMLQPDPAVALGGTGTRALFQASRDTVVLNAGREGVRWARHASANACGFCRVLAIRSAVYRSEDAALKSHDHCHCIAVPVRDGEYEPAPYLEQWTRDYKAAQAGGASTIGEIANAMDKMPGGRRYTGDGSGTVVDLDRPADEPAPDPAGPRDPNGPDDGVRTGFGDPNEFPELPDGSRVPFTPADVPPLVDGDYAHFAGTDGSGQGGHIAGLGRDKKTEFPQWVQSLDDLQRVQDAVLANPARVQPGRFGRYEVRGLVEVNGAQMVVQVVLEPDGIPAGIYPVNGDFVVKNVKGRPIPQPLDRDALLGWKRGV